MLLFSSGTFTVDGITVFPDHADPKQYWYLPGPVGLEVQSGSTNPQFNLIMYTPDVASAGIQGGGFLMTTLCLTLSPQTQSKIISKIRSLAPEIADPLLSPVYFDEGTVQVVSLDLQGSGGTTQADAASGIGHAVQKILGASTPNLFGNNDAIFDLVLTPEGATILKAAFADGMTPVGGIYNMKFTGVQPALDVKITCDMKRAYQSFSVSLAANAYFVSAGIDATFEKLRQDGTIKMEVVSLVNDATTAAQEQWALNLFKDQIMAQWFAPSLGPTTEAAADAQNVNVNAKGTATTTPTTSTTTTQTQTRPVTSGGGMTPPVQNAGQMGNAQASHPAPAPNAGMSTPAAPRPVTTPPPTPPPTPPTTPPTVPPAPPTPAPGGAAIPPPTTVTPPTATPPPPGGATTPTPATPPAPTAPPAANSTTTTTAPPTPSTGAAIANAIGSVAGTAAGASSAASPFGVALRLKYVNQDELKTVEIEFNQMSAVQRTYSPQGYFGLMLAGLDQSKLFLQVDGNNPFFTAFAVTVNPPKDFESIGLKNAHVALDYGIATDPTRPAPKHGEYNFEASNMPPQVWDIFEGNIQSNLYSYTSDYTFDPDSGWVGDQLRYTSPTVETENRTLMLDPYSFLSFLRVNIIANRMDANFVDRVEVALAFVSAGGWSTSQIMVVHPGNAPQVWKVRALSDPSDATKTTSYTQTFTSYLKDGTVIAGQPIQSSATSIFVNDPFVGAIDITLLPAFTAAAWQYAYVEITYQDASTSFHFNTTQQLLPGGAAVKIHIPVLDRRQMQFQYQVTMLGVSGQQYHGQPVTTDETQLLISATPQ
ncbi:MAG TPA: hypothetical protein VGU46_03975 [Acidobacteriaceae bacterium]|nr:hypothetical protein [Acidobacteriaceae bacterium]